MTSCLVRAAATCCMLLLSTSLQAQDAVVATLFGEEISLNEISPNAAELNQMAKVNSASKDMALAQYRHGRLTELILKQVTDDYASEKALETDSTLVEKFKQKFGPELEISRKKASNKAIDKETQADGKAAPTKSIDEIAKEQVRHWQINKALYNEFGGTVVFQQSDPQFPVQAYEMLLKRYQQEGKFKILDDRYSAVFWEVFEPPYSFELSADQIDFSSPWWLTK